MRAIVFENRNVVAVQDRPAPKPGAGEVPIEVHARGICGTDLEVLHGNYGTSAYPVIPGHEYAGLVIDVGADVTDVKAGDRVSVDPNLECGHYSACTRG
jgi:D-arabinose 1-dehydrogenase-like Zn-dependent alcohol dehydrogenase